MTSAVPVSVVIPCYNRADLVTEAIGSVLGQVPGMEVIVVDDGSTDSSWAVIESFGEQVRGIRVANGGLSSARNVGLEAARGEFVRFLDSDDRVPPDALRRQLEEARLLAAHQLAVGDAASIDWSGNRIPPVGYGYSAVAAPGPIPRPTVIRHIMNAWLPLFPTQALRAVGGFDRDVVLIEDHEVAMRLLRAGFEFVRVPFVVCEVREHGGERLSRNLGPAGYDRLRTMFEQLWSDFETSPAPALTLPERAALGKLVWTAARDASREGYEAPARATFQLAERIAGAEARSGSKLIRLLYRLMPPFAAERLVMRIKSAARRPAQ